MDDECETLIKTAQKIYDNDGDLSRAKKILERALNIKPCNEATSNNKSASTKNQLEAIERVKKSKNYYETLCVDRGASDSDIKKAYKKFALQFHPDKNSTPGADEAFKLISQAYSVLSNPDKRRAYDSNRLDVNGNPRQTPTYFEEEISPEEIFNAFFGGGNIFSNT